MLKDWTDAQILQAYKNGGLATIVYQAQSEYVGPEHELQSILMLARVFKVLAEAAQEPR